MREYYHQKKLHTQQGGQARNRFASIALICFQASKISIKASAQRTRWGIFPPLLLFH